MITITFDLTNESDCNRVREILTKPVDTSDLDKLNIPSGAKMLLIKAGYTTIDSIEKATDATLKKIPLIGPWRIKEIRNEILYSRTGKY